MKLCTKCLIRPRKTTKGGNTGQCIECNRQVQKAWRAKNHQRVLKYEKQYRESNHDARTQAQRTWKIRNPEQVRQYNTTYFKQYYTNTNNRLAKNLRNRLRQAIKKNYKNGSAVSDLGCSVAELVIYLESKFQTGMSWSNYGVGINRWGIDHIRPLDSFNLTDRSQLLQACHYTNLQPMWTQENSRKCAA